MSRSLALAENLPEASFRSAFSHTEFESKNTAEGVRQSFARPSESGRLRVGYAIGSGNHAIGFLAQVGDHLFQSPISYYTSRRVWDVAPGYEDVSTPDFSRPVTVECLTCHADKPLSLTDTLNSYQSPPFKGMAISCDRCHGSPESHLQRPVPGSILNPAKLTGAARDSICEQCHLAGEIRIPNPGKSIVDFRPGEKSEDVFSVYIAAHPIENRVKVISHSEQLALSMCARNSSGKLWCGTCHNPHDKPVESQAVAYYRERCLACHAATLPVSHGAPDRDCVTCHMPRRPAKDGGHTAFTDHRISRRPEESGQSTTAPELKVWRPGPAALRDRNLALALVTEGLQNSVSDQVIQGYKILNRLGPSLGEDAPALTVLGTVLLTAKQPAEAKVRFERAIALHPGYAPYEVNLANALLATGENSGALAHLERAVDLDPLLSQAVYLLAERYRKGGETSKADHLLEQYRRAMGISVKPLSPGIQTFLPAR